MIKYLEIDDALEQVAFLGFYVKDAGLLDSALRRPQATVFGEDAYPSLSLKAAAMMHSIIKNHPMVDDNKRTSWILFVSFIVRNGYIHNMTDQQGFDLTLNLATDQIDIFQAAEIIDSHLVSRS